MVRNALDYLFERPHRQTQNQRRKRHDFNLTYFGPTTYDSGTPVVELDGSGSVSATNTFGANGLLSRRVGSTSVFYTFDERGNTTQRLNSSGGVITSHISDAYGTTASSAATTDPYDGYGAQAGYYTDHETGLMLCTFRYYDPANGRWLNRDPIGYGGGINMYSYCGNNPVGFVDPSGLRWVTVCGARFNITGFSSEMVEMVIDQLRRICGTESGKNTLSCLKGKGPTNIKWDATPVPDPDDDQDRSGGRPRQTGGHPSNPDPLKYPNVMTYDPETWLTLPGRGKGKNPLSFPPDVVLAHELGHIGGKLDPGGRHLPGRGAGIRGTPIGPGDNIWDNENPYRQETGRPLRYY